MPDNLTASRESLIQELGRLSDFAGFGKAMGQIYGLLYLSREAVSLGEIAEQLGISKGNASLNIQTMERWGLIQPISKKGDRRDFYLAETDFWKIIHDILTERDKKEVDRTLNALKSISLQLSEADKNEMNEDLDFYQKRLKNMVEFGNAAAQMLEAFINMGNVRDRRHGDTPPAGAKVKRIDIVE